jgi:hypothetical protein
LGNDGSVALGATVQDPPYGLSRAPARLSRLPVTTGLALGTVTSPVDVLVDPAGTSFSPGGSTTFAGTFDAALVRLRF